MHSTIKCLCKDYFILLLYNQCFVFLILYAANKDNCHELWIIILPMDHLARLVVSCFDVGQDNVVYSCGESLEFVNLLKEEPNKVFLIGGPIEFLAYFWNGEQLRFIFGVHKLQEAFLFGQPTGKIIELLFRKFNGFCIWKAIISSWCCLLFDSRSCRQCERCLLRWSFHPTIDNVKEIQCLLHCYFV